MESFPCAAIPFMVGQGALTCLVVCLDGMQLHCMGCLPQWPHLVMNRLQPQ